MDAEPFVPEGRRLAEGGIRLEARGTQCGAVDDARTQGVSLRGSRLASRTRMTVRTPFGRDLAIEIGPEGVEESRFVARRPNATKHDEPGSALAVRRQLEAYFARRLTRFDVPLALVGTPLQLAIWHAVAAIPAGTIVSYAEIARAVGRPNAHRAVASALARTPLALFVPAHRVVGADGRVRGAAPGSMRLRLLRFEGAIVRGSRVSARRA